MTNGFDKLAKKATTATKKASVKVAAEVTKDVMQKVTKLISTKAQIKQLELDKATLEQEVIAVVRPQQDTLAYAGNYTNALEVAGAGEGEKVLYITQDRFVIPQEEDNLNELRKVCGKVYDEFFEVRRVISVKESVVKETSGEKLNRLVEACKKAGIDIAEVFDVADKVVSKPGLDQKQYELSAEKLASFRTVARQFKPALK
jgi:hypothetical protein